VHYRAGFFFCVTGRSIRAWRRAAWAAYLAICIATIVRLAAGAPVDHPALLTTFAAAFVIAALSVRRRLFSEPSLVARARALVAVWLLGVAAAAFAAATAGGGAIGVATLGVLASGVLLVLTPPKALGGDF
jgi:hypothetical protein